ncbi:SRPBCC domain-containing protein [Streptomyces drozdowiczii]|uniref:SRPBCC domain-containing protein n=1 Tax=Streptomyces drozdowiczii TaxID=202862 RepID=A0ABY6Q399_9ACTN|nr:SRPBCC domain-containing protein [Streptomyces drozdowiczii]MCX0244693.1 SRPBCC domain-containing protein [Streptomyces drozdowiczii]UZK58531.1 SRPBCC domain-containing protein [Streptomyces drozdowiczii]
MFVPVPVPALRRTLGDPVRVARCVPGFQQDADASAGPLAGRLRIRAGGHTITYRGTLRLTPLPGDPDVDSVHAVLVEGEGTEARGGGSAKLSLTLRLTEGDEGTSIAFEGGATGDGRLRDLEPAAALSTAHRLLDRFAQQLVTESLAAQGEGAADEAWGGAGAGDAGAEGAGASAGAPGTPGAAEVTADELAVGEAVEKALEEAAEEADQTGPEPSAGSPLSGSGPLSGAEESLPTHEAAPDEAPGVEQPGQRGAEPEGAQDDEEPSQDQESLFDAPVPPSSLDPVAGIEFTVPDEPPAEAAHARRTMIGRSAEEVDHAPPRGRYAPVPSPDSGGAGATLRWVAPAAALALASAVVVSRALRRRR